MIPGSKTLNPVVVFTLSPAGLAIARSLAPRGVTVYGVDSIKYEIGHFSRWITHDKRISYLPVGKKLLEGLIQFGKEQKIKPVIFLAGDPYIDFIAQNKEVLDDYYIMPESMCEKVNSEILHKETFYARCSDLEILTPLTFFPETEGQAVIASKKLRYPALVKPALGYMLRKKLNGQKLVCVDNPDELIKWWKKLKDWGDNTVLQEVIEGPEANIVVVGLYMNSKLKCTSLFTAVKNRQYPPMYGSGSYLEAKWLPDIAETSINIMQRLGYKGICGLEFKWDNIDKNWKLIEINCRPTLWFALPKAAGVDIVWDAYCDLTGKENETNIGNQDDSVRWQLLVRDIVSGIHFLKTGQLSIKEFIRTVISPFRKKYAVLSANDLKASLAYPLDTVIKYWTHFVKK